MIIRPSFSDILRDIAMATNLVAKMGQNYLPRTLIALSFRKLMGDHYLNVHINSENDASISCENFVKFSPETSELTGLICECQVRHGQKTGAFSWISPDILDRFTQSFHHIKALYVQMMDLYLIFQFFKGRCHGNQIILRECYQCRLIPLAFVPLMLENELQYHGLAVRINSGDDGATSSKNLVNFWLVTLEMTGLIWVTYLAVSYVRYDTTKKLAYFVEYLRIYFSRVLL